MRRRCCLRQLWSRGFQGGAEGSSEFDVASCQGVTSAVELALVRAPAQLFDSLELQPVCRVRDGPQGTLDFHFSQTDGTHAQEGGTLVFQDSEEKVVEAFQPDFLVGREQVGKCQIFSRFQGSGSFLVQDLGHRVGVGVAVPQTRFVAIGNHFL